LKKAEGIFFVYFFSTIFHFLIIFLQGFNPPSGWNWVESHFKPTLNVPKIWSLVIMIICVIKPGFYGE